MVDHPYYSIRDEVLTSCRVNPPLLYLLRTSPAPLLCLTPEDRANKEAGASTPTSLCLTASTCRSV
jgi:hypothetical protein